jgi:two-component system OmpR family response regulator
MKLFLVEDEERMARMLARGLSEEGHQVDVCASGVAARDQALSIAYDVIVLDWSLPDLDGVSVLRAWRARGLRTPVILLTARGSTGEKVTGLRAGADDYLVKPFDFAELLARLEALNRRNGAVAVEALGAVALDPRRRALLLTRSHLLRTVWGDELAGSANVVDVYVGYVRAKIERLGAVNLRIEAVRGVGYRLVAPPPEAA